MDTRQRRIARLKVEGDRLLKKVRELVHQGNVRRIVIKGENGHIYLEIPLTIGVASAVLLPVWSAVGALAALARGFTVEIEKEVAPRRPRPHARPAHA